MTTPSFTILSDDLDGCIGAALDATRAGTPVILLDDFDRENEADLIAAEDGAMMRGARMEAFARARGFTILTIAELVEWRMRQARQAA